MSEQTPAVGEVEGTPGPVIEIVGDATPEQVAALVAVLSAAAGGESDEGSGRSRFRSGWTARDRGLRPALPHGRGAWRASARP